MDDLTQEFRTIIEAADRAITAGDYDSLMDFYAEDATLVIKPGMTATGKAQIKRAFGSIAQYFNNALIVTQGKMQVIAGGDVALVVMETLLHGTDADGRTTEFTRRATYVFQQLGGRWLCAVDNSYGTALLDDVAL